MKALLMIAVSTLAMMIGQARAALIPENGFTLDTTTGLEWIDAQTTDGYSPAAILAGAGGFLAEGWQYATVDQWDTLMEQYVAPSEPATNNTVGLQSVGLSQPQYFLAASIVSELLGVNLGFNYPLATDDITSVPGILEIYTQGWLAGTDGAPGLGTLGAGYDGTGFYGVWETDFNALNSDDINGAPNVANLLVRSVNPVPEPASLALFGIGLLGCVIGRNRRRRTVNFCDTYSSIGEKA